MNCKRIAAILLIGAALCTGGCGQTQVDSEKKPVETTANGKDMFTKRDLNTSYDKSTAEQVVLDKDLIEITKEGTYILSGEFENGQIKVSVGDNEKVQLVLDGFNATSNSTAPIYVENADKVFITVADGSQNSITVGNFTDEKIDAAIFSKDDLTVNGEGTLTINSVQNGITSKNDLVLAAENIKVEAYKNGIAGKDSIRVASGTYKIIAGKDGLRSKNKDEPDSEGFIYIENGTFDIQAEKKAILSGLDTHIVDGKFTLKCGDIAIQAKTDLTIDGGSFEIDTNAEHYKCGGKSRINANV